MRRVIILIFPPSTPIFTLWHLEKLPVEDSFYDGLENYSVADLVNRINTEDQKVAIAVEKVLPEITKLIEKVETQLHNGGRLFYMGAVLAEDWGF